MAKNVLSSIQRRSAADKYLIKLLLHSEVDFKPKRVGIIKASAQTLLNTKQEDVHVTLQDQTNQQSQLSTMA